MDSSAVECQYPRISLSYEHPRRRASAEGRARPQTVRHYDFIAAYEAEHGEITDDQMEAAYRRAKARAVVVLGGHAVNDKRVPRAAPAAQGRDLLVADPSEVDDNWSET
jgi:hypothetical protein